MTCANLPFYSNCITYCHEYLYLFACIFNTIINLQDYRAAKYSHEDPLPRILMISSTALINLSNVMLQLNVHPTTRLVHFSNMGMYLFNMWMIYKLNSANDKRRCQFGSMFSSINLLMVFMLFLDIKLLPTEEKANIFVTIHSVFLIVHYLTIEFNARPYNLLLSFRHTFSMISLMVLLQMFTNMRNSQLAALLLFPVKVSACVVGLRLIYRIYLSFKLRSHKN